MANPRNALPEIKTWRFRARPTGRVTRDADGLHFEYAVEWTVLGKGWLLARIALDHGVGGMLRAWRELHEKGLI